MIIERIKDNFEKGLTPGVKYLYAAGRNRTDRINYSMLIEHRTKINIKCMVYSFKIEYNGYTLVKNDEQYEIDSSHKHYYFLKNLEMKINNDLDNEERDYKNQITNKEINNHSFFRKLKIFFLNIIN